MSDYCIWWIDDRPRREEKADHVERESDCITVDFSLPDRAIEQVEEDSFPDADLVLIDWVLNDEHDVISRGVSMEGIVREHLPRTPTYGFSGEETEELQEAQNERRFEAVFDLRGIISNEGITNLEKDLQDYELIESVRGDGFEALRNTLQPPSEGEEQLTSIIPREFSDGLQEGTKTKGGSKLEFARWVRERFLNTPGPLWNDQWLATNLGVSKTSLEPLAATLRESDRAVKYEGIFSHRVENRWWSSEVIGAVVELVDSSVADIQQAAPMLVPEEDREIATCDYCGEKYPDTVAAIKEGRDAEHPVHFRCSEIHHSREGPFEDYRVADKLTENNDD